MLHSIFEFLCDFRQTISHLKICIQYWPSRVPQVELIRTLWCLTKTRSRSWRRSKVIPRRSPLSFTIHPRFVLGFKHHPVVTFYNKPTFLRKRIVWVIQKHAKYELLFAFIVGSFFIPLVRGVLCISRQHHPCVVCHCGQLCPGGTCPWGRCHWTLPTCYWGLSS